MYFLCFYGFFFYLRFSSLSLCLVAIPLTLNSSIRFQYHKSMCSIHLFIGFTFLTNTTLHYFVLLIYLFVLSICCNLILLFLILIVVVLIKFAIVAIVAFLFQVLLVCRLFSGILRLIKLPLLTHSFSSFCIYFFYFCKVFYINRSECVDKKKLNKRVIFFLFQFFHIFRQFFALNFGKFSGFPFYFLY